ncbi:MAG: Peptidoglycan-N-acetylglucosamine deacetylase [Chloroflexi bacterium]|nr:Peptidoglycan-N-acetylglucosamine deacetylase [Chloroflexota bacterium]
MTLMSKASSRPELSVVIPALNEEKLLPECLKSLECQDYRGQYEVIMVDNGSTDATASIARNFGIKVISCPEIKSVFYARQVGADAARGDIVVQADADTVYPKGWLNRIASQFASHPEVAAIAGRFFYSDEFLWARVEHLLKYYINRVTVALFGRPLIVSGATFAFRRRDFLSLNGYRGLSYSPDQYGICARLSKRGKVLYDKDLYCLTSARRVQKPTFIIILDVLAHLASWGAYLIQSSLSNLQGLTTRMQLRKAARLVRVPVLGTMLLHGYFLPASSASGKVYHKRKTTEKVVALTFDDGPNEPYTSEILDMLASHNIKATFFVIGKNVELYPEIARRIMNEGHVIGNHSHTHNANHALTQYGSRDLRLAQRAIYDIIGVSPHLYRPPHGRKTPWQLKAVQEEGLIAVTWSVAVNDQHALALCGKVSPEPFARKIVRKTKPGKIILLHDGYGTGRDGAKSDRGLTLKALPLIIERLQAKGYRFITVPDLLGVPAYNGTPLHETDYAYDREPAAESAADPVMLAGT